MRNSLLLITLGTVLAFSTAGPLLAQTPPAAPPPKSTNSPAVTGVLASPVVFEWKRAHLDAFLDQIKKVFGYDLKAHADIPGEMLDTRVVPSIKVETARVWDVLDLYNSISKDYPELGRWVVNWQGVKTADSEASQPLGSAPRVLGWAPRKPLSGPTALYLVAPQQTDTEESSSVRAFTVRGFSVEEQKQLREIINVELRRLQDPEVAKGINPSLLRGEVHFHEETGICVAAGGKTYVEMVGSLIDALREGSRFQLFREDAKPKN